MPDPETPGHGIRVDVELDLDREPGPEPVPPRSRIPNAAIGFAAVLIVLAAATVAGWKWLPVHTPQAETAVRAYLEAVQAGDVETALAMVGDVSGAATDYLAPEALDSRWVINEVAQVSYSEHTLDGTTVVYAEVYVEIEAFDGTRLGGRLGVQILEGDVSVQGGMRFSFFDSEILEHFGINGLSADMGHMMEEFWLLPGVYEFYEHIPSTIDVDMPPVLVLGNELIPLGGSHTLPRFPRPTIEATSEGRELVAERLREHFDTCAARPQIEGCAFALPPESEGRIALAEGAEWTITAYPEATTAPWRHGTLGHELFTAEPGRAEVPVTVTEPGGGGTHETTLSCAIWVDGIYAKFDFDGGVTVTPHSTAADSCRSMAEAD